MAFFNLSWRDALNCFDKFARQLTASILFWQTLESQVEVESFGKPELLFKLIFLSDPDNLIPELAQARRPDGG